MTAQSRPCPRHDLDFRALFEAAPGSYLVLDPSLTIVAVSDAYLAATKSSRDSLVDQQLFNALPDNPEDPSASGETNLRASFSRVSASLSADTMAVQKYNVRRPQSEGGGFETRYWSPVNSPVLGADGDLRYIIHRIDDCTDFVRFRASEREDREATAVIKARDDRAHAGAVRRSDADREATAVIKERDDLAYAGEVRRSEDLVAVNAELLIASALLDEAVAEKTRELRASNEDLRALNVEHRNLLRRIVTLQEEEQSRIANDIHDDTLQAIIVAQMRLQVFAEKVHDAAHADELERIHASVGDAVARLRDLVFELRPGELRMGVAAVLRRHLDDLVEVSGITADLRSDWTAEPDGVEQLILYRIAREALVNIRKHVSKCHVAVALGERDDGWTIGVSDEGSGFVVDDGLNAAGHLGLTSMREKAEALAGRWRIESEPGVGTTVDVWIPRPSFGNAALTAAALAG